MRDDDEYGSSRRPRLALGTAQWGQHYGIANRTGQPALAEVRRIIETACEAGIDTLDTAGAYGSAESVIGAVLTSEQRARLRVVTKVLPEIDQSDDAADVRRATESLLTRSAERLGADHLDVVLLHRESLRRLGDGAAWEVLQQWRARGDIGATGISAESPAAAARAVRDPNVGVLQVPSSLMDRRLVGTGLFDEAERRDVEVHVRSVFLQGVAFLSPASLPDHLQVVSDWLLRIRRVAAEHGVPPAAVWLAYALNLPVSRVVVGVEQQGQLAEILSWCRVARHIDVADALRGLPELGRSVLDPAMWGR